MKKNINNILLSASLFIPLNVQTDWQVLSYSKLPSHKVAFKQSGLNISVNKSAGPLVYPLKNQTSVKKVHVKGTIKKKIKFNGKQGTKNNDDFALRIGLVVKGTQTLNFAKRLIAPDWVKSLFALAPKGTGVDHIYFFNAAQQPELQGKTRNHPLSKLIKENNQWLLKFDENGVANFDFSTHLTNPKKTLAIWISVDGDDTKSNFETLITELKIN